MMSRRMLLWSLVALAGAAGPVAALRGQVDPNAAAQAAVPRISLAEFKKLHDAGGVVVLDVRAVAAYQAGHVPGALSVPLPTVSGRAATWKDEKKPIVTYCS